MTAHTDFRAFYDAHVGLVYRVLRRLGVDDKDLADVAQNVFVVALRRLPAFEGRAKLTTWVFSICHRVVKDYLVAAPRRREVGEVDLRSLAATSNPERDLEQRERLTLAESIIAKIPAEQRTVFLLFEVEGLSGEDIAALIDVPEGTVRSRLRLARTAFQREVANYNAQCAEADERS